MYFCFVLKIGICIDNVDGKSSCIIKSKGRLSNLCDVIKFDSVPEGNCSINGISLQL